MDRQGSERPRPYVGWTGPGAVEEVEAVLNEVGPGGPDERVLAIGVLTIHRTIESRGPAEAHPKRYPPSRVVGHLVRAVGEDALGFIHYRPSPWGMLHAELPWVCETVGAVSRGLQLNQFDLDKRVDEVGPMSRWLERQLGAPPRLIGQLHPRLLGRFDRLPRLIEFVKSFADSGGTDVLVDPSCGGGVRIDPKQVLAPMEVSFLELLEALADQVPHVGLGIAGGLSADAVRRLGHLFEAFPGLLSVDAESGVRDRKTDEVALDAVIDYVRAAREQP